MAMDKGKLADLLREAGLGDYVDAIMQYAKPAIRLHARGIENPDSLPLGASRIGGLPDLPPNANWPTRNGRHCEFIAQIDLKEASQFDQSGLLPKTGMLFFFFDGMSYEDKPYQKHQKGSETIIYYTGDVSSLKRLDDYPQGLQDWQRYQNCPIVFEAEWMLPAWWGAVAYALERKVLNRPLWMDHDERTPSIKAYEALTDDLEPPEDHDKHHLFGYPQPIIQDDPLYELSKAFILNSDEIDEEKLEEWVLLLQISSDPFGSGMLWADTSSLYYYIRKHDLAAMRFENTVCEMQFC